jgi:predicted Rossmann fold flavoprotein
VVIGAGAAGYFSAIACAQANSKNEVILVEKTSKTLQKVLVSGGGRCNVTHACFDAKQLSLNYPRGEKELRAAFAHFQPQDTMNWFESRGVKLKIESDNRVFPVSNNSESIIDALEEAAKKAGVRLILNCGIQAINKKADGSFKLLTTREDKLIAKRIIIASGGSPKEAGLNWLKELGHEIETPVPSLFTFNIKDPKLRALSGISSELAQVKISGTKIESNGPVLITHWGLSGPAILKCSAFAARILAEKAYNFDVEIKWVLGKKEDALRQELMDQKASHPSKQIQNSLYLPLPKRLLFYLLNKSGIDEQSRWQEVSKDSINQFIISLLYDKYRAEGKTGFKEEFVTCGGVSRSNIDFKTMESKKVSGLYFAGEIIDMDGITGGFNFQAAWTTGFIAGNAAAKS